MADTTETKKRKFRLNCKNLFLTWPKNDTDPSDVMGALLDRFGYDNVSYICVSQEEHKDGDPHLHALVCLKEKCDIKNSADLNVAAGGKQGNYQSTRKVKDVYKYVQKGGKFVEHGEFPQTDTEKKSSLIANAIRNGQSLEQVEEMDPAFFMLHMRLLTSYQQFQQRKKIRLTPPRLPMIYSFRKTLIEIGYPRVHKQKQYWICGPPNSGKTSLILDLSTEGFRGYEIPTNNDFSLYDDHMYDFAYIDEFRGALTIQFLNLWLEGSKQTLNYKGGSYQKQRNILTFIISNFGPYEVYHKCAQSEINALSTRLEIILT
ncbi:Rep [uncultured virus]|uniref:Rep n=1 Tax=uncultured virus TaxID=340016 RepID=A0A2K9LWJ5_9VIRU|nr:Rep [uncultured virus]